MAEPISQLRALGADVDWPDSEASVAVRNRVANRPELGRLAALAEWAAGVRSAEGGFTRVSAVVVDAPPDRHVDDAIGSGRVRRAEADGGIDAAVAVADDEIERGCELFVLGLPADGTVRDAAAAVCVLTDVEPVKVLARGVAATDPVSWMELATAVRDDRLRCLPTRDEPDDLLAALDSARLAFGAGLVLRAAARRTPVLVDGPVAAAAALVAYEAQPRAVRWWSAADRGVEPLQELALSRLGLDPILGLGTGLGTGLAGLLCVPVIRAAVELAADIVADDE